MYKIKYALKKGKAILIVCAILWVILSIVLIAPGAISVVEHKDFEKTIVEYYIDIVGNIFGNLINVFKGKYILTFLKGELYLAVVLLGLGIVGLLKTLPKNEYTDIEHGSSDWATGGEQYQILSNKKGIILAEKNYLPVDKRGNVNVLIVGRFWCW